MKWESVADFLAMGGYATYVWGSYVVAALAVAIEVVLVRRRLRAARRQLPRAS